MATRKRLYKSSDDKMIEGVCAGVADYFNIDPTIVRIVFALGLVVGGGTTGIIYLMLMYIMPEAPAGYETPVEDDVESILNEREYTNRR